MGALSNHRRRLRQGGLEVSFLGSRNFASNRFGRVPRFKLSELCRLNHYRLRYFLGCFHLAAKKECFGGAADADSLLCRIVCGIFLAVVRAAVPTEQVPTLVTMMFSIDHCELFATSGTLKDAVFLQRFLFPPRLYRGENPADDQSIVSKRK